MSTTFGKHLSSFVGVRPAQRPKKKIFGLLVYVEETS